MTGPTAVAKDSRIGARLGLWALLALVALLFVWPVVMLLVGIFRSGAPGMPGTWTLAGLSRVLGAPATYAALSNSMLYALFTTALATVLGAVAAFAATRTLAWGRQLLTPVMLLVFAAPNLLYAVAWSLLVELAQIAGGKPLPGETVLGRAAEQGAIVGQAGVPHMPDTPLVRPVILG